MKKTFNFLFIIILLLSCNNIFAFNYYAKKTYDIAKTKSNVYSRIRFLKKIVKRYPQDKYAQKAQFEIAQSFFLLENFKQSQREFLKYIKLYPKSENIKLAYFYIGISYLELFNKSKALLWFNKMGRNKKAYIAKGDVYFKFKNYSKAQVQYEKVLKEFNDEDVLSSFYYKLAKTYQKLGKWKMSKKYFNLVLDKYSLSNEAELVKKELGENAPFNFSVQLGSFSSKKNAYSLCDKMLRKNYDAFVVLPQISGDRMYKVRIGYFNTRKDAMNMLNTIRQTEKIIGKIVP